MAPFWSYEKVEVHERDKNVHGNYISLPVANAITINDPRDGSQAGYRTGISVGRGIFY